MDGEMGKESLAALGRYLHQDIDLDAGNLVELVSNALHMMQPKERDDLRVYLKSVLERCSPSELKGLLNRANGNWRFTSSGADQFLRTVAGQLAAAR
jgi:hypothetical protein